MTTPKVSGPTTQYRPAAQYRDVPAQIDLPEMEYDVIDFWETNQIFEKSLEQTVDGKPWTFYEGPPTANGQPGTHHVEARVFKDVFPRFRTMQGYHVERKAGWDCHGLPVELAVEKELGFNGKADIEAYGVEAFNAKCRESVSRHVDQFKDLTRRMGYWVNMDEAYWTMSPEYVESVWWALKQIYDKKLLVEDFKVAPFCPRCETTLSDHELAQGYQNETVRTVYVRMPLTSGRFTEGRYQDKPASLLIWTTTPWTLVSNTAVAVHPDVTYVAATDGNETLIVAEALVESALGEGWTVVDSFLGKEMEYWSYQRPFELVEWPSDTKVQPGGELANIVILADYVTIDDGTGLVHEAPAFGADDMISCRAYDLPMVNPINTDGTFKDSLPLVGGVFFRTADEILIQNLDDQGLLFKHWDFDHDYPHCWRCDTPLMYYAQLSWYVKTTQIKQRLLEENEQTNWFPENIKHGRYGDWLENNIDWDLSRSRYWGTPLPIWRNDEDPSKTICVGSLKELGEYAGQDLSDLDPHRPYVDDITFTIDGEPGTYRRVPEVIDAWADSGAMPFAQWGYPYVEGSVEKFENAYPADFICEAIDQTRGWFYTLMAVGTLVFDQSSYKNVLCLGHILAEDGRKMSKHLGNILLPIPLMDKHGADALRWFMAASGSPWLARRVGDSALQEIVRKVMLTYWNTVAFHALYARANDWSPSGRAPALAERHIVDRWLIAKVNQLIVDVTKHFENFDTQRAGSELQQFIDDLSNWYVRRSRRRFWDGEESALWTLHEVLNVLTRLMSPMAPFITERVWQDLYVSSGNAGVPSSMDNSSDVPQSVHLTAWPVADESAIRPKLLAAMSTVRRLVELGRSARSEAKLKTRQPLERALVPSQALSQLSDELIEQIKDELNVLKVESFSDAGDLVDYSAKANYRSLGARFAKKTPLVAKAIAEMDAAELAQALAEFGKATIDFEDGIEITSEDVIISEKPREGWTIANEHGETVALDLELTKELIQAGLARDVVRFIQETRKASGLDVTDRISLYWDASEKVAAAIEAHQEMIADEVLATSMAKTEATDDWAFDDYLGMRVLVVKDEAASK